MFPLENYTILISQLAYTSILQKGITQHVNDLTIIDSTDKGKVDPLQAAKGYTGRGRPAPLIFNPTTRWRWMVILKPRLLCQQKKTYWIRVWISPCKDLNHVPSTLWLSHYTHYAILASTIGTHVTTLLIFRWFFPVMYVQQCLVYSLVAILYLKMVP